MVVSEDLKKSGSEPVLIVDDNPMNRKLARLLLELEGYRVETANDAEDARRLLKGFRPELILMDLQMPGEDGLELTRQLKESSETRDIIILIVTSYDLKGQETRAQEAGCNGYFTKPIDTVFLPQLISQYLRGDGNSPTTLE